MSSGARYSYRSAKNTILFILVFMTLFISNTAPVLAVNNCYEAGGTCVGSDSGSGLQNPLNSQFSSIGSFVEGAVKVVIGIAIPILAMMIMYSGFMFVAARGNSKKLQVARQNFIYVIIGTIMILGFSAFILLLENTVSQLLG